MPFSVKPVQDIVSDILFSITQNVPGINDLNPGSVLRTMVEALATEVELLYTDLEGVYNGTRIETSSGTDLDNLGSLVGITRKEGTVATSDVTFLRSQISNIDFTIPAGSIISTQPNTGETQLRYTVDANTVFFKDITAEVHKFRDGIYQYTFDQRFIGEIDLMTGTAASVGYTFIENTDFQIVKNTSILRIDATSIILADNCDATTGWTPSTNATAPAVDNVQFIQGTGSLKLGKNGITNNEASYEKILTPVISVSGLETVPAIYIKDQFTLNKIQKIGLLFGSGGTDANSYYLEISQSRLSLGWNRYNFNPGDSTVVVTGVPNPIAINFIRITIFTNLIGDIITSGNVDVDHWIFANTENYEGDVVEFIRTGTVPDDNTNFSTDYKPLSKEVACTSEAVGASYNVGIHKIIFKVSIIANIDNVNNYHPMANGTDVEIDDDFRSRIQLATQTQAKATATALRQAVLAIEGVTSVNIYDLPEKVQSDEPIRFYTGIDDYKLDFEVAIDDTNIVISDTIGGPADYVKGVDYIMENSTIVWQAIGTKPVNLATFYVSYHYNWLGHVEMFVSGTTSPLSPAVVTNITTAIADTKAAGVVVVFSEPTIINVNITVNVSANTSMGYTFAQIQPNVLLALSDYMNAHPVGDNVYLADIYAICQGIEGVLNTTISLPVADVTITNSEVARAGTIVVNSL